MPNTSNSELIHHFLYKILRLPTYSSFFGILKVLSTICLHCMSINKFLILVWLSPMLSRERGKCVEGENYLKRILKNEKRLISFSFQKDWRWWKKEGNRKKKMRSITISSWLIQHYSVLIFFSFYLRGIAIFMPSRKKPKTTRGLWRN